MGSWRTCESCNTDEEAESWFGCQFTAGSWDVLGCCFPHLHPGASHALNCCTIPEVLHQLFLPAGPSPPKMPCAMPAVAWTGVNGSLQAFSDSFKAPNSEPLYSFSLLLFCGEAGFLATLCPQFPGQGWASCRWWNLQSLLLRRCIKHSCEVEMTSDRRCAFASWMWYNPVLIKAVAADY